MGDIHATGQQLHTIDYAYVHIVNNTDPFICIEDDWTGKLANQNWAECPTGYYINGFFREGDRYDRLKGVSQISKARCCRPPAIPEGVWGECDHFPAWTNGCGF